MDLLGTPELQSREQSAWEPDSFQPEEHPLYSDSVRKNLLLVEHLKNLDAQNEREMQESAAQEHFPDIQTPEARPSSEHLAGYEEGTSSGVSTASPTSTMLFSDRDQPDSKEPDLKFKEPDSTSAAGLAVEVALSSGVDMPSTVTVRNEIDVQERAAQVHLPGSETSEAGPSTGSEAQMLSLESAMETFYDAIQAGCEINVSDLHPGLTSGAYNSRVDFTALYALAFEAEIEKNAIPTLVTPLGDARKLPEDPDEQLIDDEEVRVKILKAVIDGKNDDAWNETKARMFKLVGRRPPQDFVEKGSLYALCEGCLGLLKQYFLESADSPSRFKSIFHKIVRHADNLNWLVDVMVERGIAQDFVTIWASQSELSNAYYKLEATHRHHVSRITATLLSGIGKGLVYANSEARYSLLKTWLDPLCDDYEWTKEWSDIDPESVEHGLGGTIFSLPEPMQHEILSAWFEKRLNSRKECPRLLGWYEIWWSKLLK